MWYPNYCHRLDDLAEAAEELPAVGFLIPAFEKRNEKQNSLGRLDNMET